MCKLGTERKSTEKQIFKYKKAYNAKKELKLNKRKKGG